MTIKRGNHTDVERFPARPVEVGGQRRSQHFIECSSCPAEATAMATGSIDDEMLIKKFSRAGWKLGRVAAQHVCPGCSTKPRPQAQPQTQPEEEIAVATTRELTFSDRRIINSKLEEVYENDTLGYRKGWSDQAVATDLGVDPIWVAKLRSENFGPERGNVLLVEIKTEQAQLQKDLEAFRAEGQKLAERVVALQKRIETAGLKAA